MKAILKWFHNHPAWVFGPIAWWFLPRDPVAELELELSGRVETQP